MLTWDKGSELCIWHHTARQDGIWIVPDAVPHTATKATKSATWENIYSRFNQLKFSASVAATAPAGWAPSPIIDVSTANASTPCGHRPCGPECGLAASQRAVHAPTANACGVRTADAQARWRGHRIYVLHLRWHHFDTQHLSSMPAGRRTRWGK